MRHWCLAFHDNVRLGNDRGRADGLRLQHGLQSKLGYLSRLGVTVVWINHRPEMTGRFDLLPGDTTQIRMGINLQSGAALADATIQDVSFDRLLP